MYFNNINYVHFFGNFMKNLSNLGTFLIERTIERRWRSHIDGARDDAIFSSSKQNTIQTLDFVGSMAFV